MREKEKICIICGKKFMGKGRAAYCPECKKAEQGKKKPVENGGAREMPKGSGLTIVQKNEIARKHGLSYGQMQGRLYAAGLDWNEHMKLLEEKPKTRKPIPNRDPEDPKRKMPSMDTGITSTKADDKRERQQDMKLKEAEVVEAKMTREKLEKFKKEMNKPGAITVMEERTPKKKAASEKPGQQDVPAKSEPGQQDTKAKNAAGYRAPREVYYAVIERIKRLEGTKQSCTDSLVMMDNEAKKITHQLEEVNKELATLQTFKETASFE